MGDFGDPYGATGRLLAGRTCGGLASPSGVWPHLPLQCASLEHRSRWALHERPAWRVPCPFFPARRLWHPVFGTGKTFCASAALILLTRMLGLKALFVAEPNLPLQEFSRNVQSLLADAPTEVLCQFPRLLGRDHDQATDLDVAYETRSQFLRDNEPCCVAITLGSLLHEIGRRPLFFRLSILCLWMSPSRRVRPPMWLFMVQCAAQP